MLGVRPAILAVSLLGVAALALVALNRQPEAGVADFREDGLIVAVEPGSPVWRAGIRAGDQIVELDDSLAPQGWRMKTVVGPVVHEVWASEFQQQLARFTGWAILAGAGAVLLAYLVFQRVRAAGLVLPLAFAVVAEPLIWAGHPLSTIVVGVAVYLGGSQALQTFAPRPSQFRVVLLVTATAGGLAALAWIAAVIALPALFDPLDAARWPVAIGLTVAGLALMANHRRASALILGTRGPAFLDVAFLAGLGAIAVGAILLQVPILAVALGLVVVVGAYPVWRRRVLGAFDRLVTASARRDAAVFAVEAERGRLAREIHDAPIQELAGVIRRLETVPGVDAETSRLRDIATSLRDVATALHPPILEDLGLAAAIEDHLETIRGTEPGWVVTTSIDDLTVDARPPSDIELAAYRVVQEAVANAVQHSGGQRLDVEATVAPDNVVVRVTDDGAGFAPDQIRAARRAGHFGLDSMTERAHAVGASLETKATADGVSIDFRWVAS